MTQEAIKKLLEINSFVQTRFPSFQISTNVISTGDKPLVARGNSDIELTQENKNEIISELLYYAALEEKKDDINEEELYIIQSIRDSTRPWPNGVFGFSDYAKKTLPRDVLSTIPNDEILCENLAQKYENEKAKYDDAYMKNIEKNKEIRKQIQEAIQSNAIEIGGMLVDAEIDIKQLNEAVENGEKRMPVSTPSPNKSQPSAASVSSNKIPIKKVAFIVIICLLTLIFAGILFAFIYKPKTNETALSNEKR